MRTFVWSDTETDGLKPGCLLEVAFIVTDAQLNELGTYESLVRPPEGFEWDKESFAYNMHNENGLIDELEAAQNALALKPAVDVELEVSAFLREHCGEQPEREKERTAFLAGNTVHFDHMFFGACMPMVNRFFHYRRLDVSAMRLGMELAVGRELEIPKTGKHRALSDIRETVEQYKGLWDLVGDYFQGRGDADFPWWQGKDTNRNQRQSLRAQVTAQGKR